jgi:hypothetical protein
MRWTRRRTRRSALMRTAKSCGPDAPTLASSSWEASFSGMTVARKPGHRGERVISRKTIAQGRPDASAEPVCSCAFLFAHFAHETAGAARTRSSLRPLISESATSMADLARNRRRDRGDVSGGMPCLEFESGTIHRGLVVRPAMLCIVRGRAALPRSSP